MISEKYSVFTQKVLDSDIWFASMHFLPTTRGRVLIHVRHSRTLLCFNFPIKNQLRQSSEPWYAKFAHVSLGMKCIL